MQLFLKNSNTPYTVRYSKKALRARIVAGAKGVEVVLPEGVDINYAEKFVERKRVWVESQHQKIEKLKQVFTPTRPKPTTTEEELALKVQLKKQVKQVVLAYHATLGTPKQIRIKKQTSRWGSCSAKGGMNINYQLAFAPQNVLEYVVVHELCHLTHMNHSKAFWALVETALPSYKQAEKWLKVYGHSLLAF